MEHKDTLFRWTAGNYFESTKMKKFLKTELRFTKKRNFISHTT